MPGLKHIGLKALTKAVNHRGYEGLETQAIAGLTVHRMGVNKDIKENPLYQDYFAKAFPESADDELFTTEMAGLAIAAFERIMVSNEAPFQRWLQGDYVAMTGSPERRCNPVFWKS